MAGISQGVFWLNANLLLWCSFIPFPTALLGDYRTNPLSAGVFGSVMALMSLSFTLIRVHVQRHPALLAPGVGVARFRRTSGQSLLFGPLLYGAGAAAAVLSTWLALAVFGLIPAYFIFFNSQPAETGPPLSVQDEYGGFTRAGATGRGRCSDANSPRC